ncbi:YunC family protein [Brevibacillus sp. SYSU BS000544]|uniref:YunC family protein n=1 Tax=Brevibacillus sp. SYSU BS000544 TaxID=3416443 RepID=UPI003CE4E4C5
MIEVQPLHFEEGSAVAVTVRLPKTTLLAVTTDKGYIMCGALDVSLLNQKLADREIIAGRAVGVKTIQQLLDAPLESVTTTAESMGITVGTTGREAIRKML